MQSKKYQLLLIEDDRTLAEGLQRALTMDDRQVHLCENLRKAKEYLQKETVDLILLDVNLPDGNGVDFLENVRKTSDVPVILLTANGYCKWTGTGSKRLHHQAVQSCGAPGESSCAAPKLRRCTQPCK